MRLLGIPISDVDARGLVATLLVEGTPDTLTAAEQITKGVERALYAVGLSRAGASRGRCSLAWRIRRPEWSSCAGR